MDISHGFLMAALVSLYYGAASFISPCIFPLIPSYVSYITGISFDELAGRESRWKNINITLFHSLAFVAGFSLIFVLLGATVSLIGQVLTQYLGVIRTAGGVVMIVLGLFVMDIVPIPFLQREARLTLKTKPAGFAGTFLVGVIFAAGWTPCIGPFLGSVLVQASQAETVGRGMALLAFYSLGLGVPFILSAIAISAFLSSFNKVKKYMKAIKIASGLVLVLMGALLVTDKMTLLTSYIMSAWGSMKGLW